MQAGGAEGADGGRPGRSCEGLLAEGGKAGNTKKGHKPGVFASDGHGILRLARCPQGARWLSLHNRLTEASGRRKGH